MVSKSQVMGAYHGKLRALSRMGVDLTVITPPHWGRQHLEISDFDGYRVRVVPCLFSGYTHFHFYRERLGALDADLVHLEEEPWSIVTQQVMRKCAKAKIPVVFFTWQNIWKRYPQPFAYFERYAHAHAHGAIAGNKEAKLILERRGFAKPVKVIPQLGVDPVIFQPRDASTLRTELSLDHKFVVGYVGRVVESKGIADLVRAMTLLRQHAVLVIVGDGDFSPMVKDLAARLGLVTRIRCLPWVKSLDVPQYMSMFDVLVLPSRTTKRWKEQFGHVLIEAMACDVPVLGSDSGEIPNVIGDGGLVFPEGDIDRLAAHLSELCKNSDYRRELGRKGRARVLRHFTDDRIAEQTLDFYLEVLGRFPNDSAQPALTTASVSS